MIQLYFKFLKITKKIVYAVYKTKRPPTDWERIFTYPKSEFIFLTESYAWPQ
jgi:hypothetical protein